MTAAYIESDMQSHADSRQTVVVRGRNRLGAPLVTNRDGSRIVGDGGTQNCLHSEDSPWLGNAPALIGDHLLLDVQGAGLKIDGGLNLIGYWQETGPWKGIKHSVLPPLAMRICGSGGKTVPHFALDSGCVNAGPLFIGGFQRGIQFGEGLDENNADNCDFGYIACSHVDNLICFKNRQSVSNKFRHLRQFADGAQDEQRAFELLRFEAGGKCLVDHVEINQGLVCRAIRSDWNTGFCRINTISVDPAGGQAFKLFDGAPENGKAPCPFMLSIGSLWNGVDWRESSATAGYLIDAYAGQRVSIEGGGLLEASNGPSIRLRGTKAERAVCEFRGVKFDSQSTFREMLSDDSENYTLVAVDCYDRAGVRFSDMKTPRTKK